MYLVRTYDANGKPVNKKHYYFLLVVFILLSGLSYRLGVDIVRYQEYFENGYYSKLEFNSLFEVSTEWGQEPLWVLVNWFFYHFTGEFWIMKLAIATFVNIVIFSFIKKHSSAPYTSILLYFVFGAYFQLNFQVLRESITISLFLIALGKLTGSSKGLIKYYLIIIPAIFFHRFAILALLFPLLSFIKISRIFYIILGLLLISIPFLSTILDNVLDLRLLNMLFGVSVRNYQESEMYGMLTMNIFGYIRLFVLYILPMVFLLKYSKKDYILSLALLYVVILILRSSSFVILYRLNNYFVFPLIIALADSFSKIIYKKKYGSTLNTYVLSCFCAIVLLFSYVYRTVSSEEFVMYYPYSSILTMEQDKERELFYMSLGSGLN